MKKKILSLLLIVMLCCSAIYIFAGCEGNGTNSVGKLTCESNSADSPWLYELNVEGFVSVQDEVVKNGHGSAMFKYPGGPEGGISLDDMIKNGCAISGLNTREAHTGTMTITYLMYTCLIYYSVA